MYVNTEALFKSKKIPLWTKGVVYFKILLMNQNISLEKIEKYVTNPESEIEKYIKDAEDLLIDLQDFVNVPVYKFLLGWWYTLEEAGLLWFVHILKLRSFFVEDILRYNKISENKLQEILDSLSEKILIEKHPNGRYTIKAITQI